MNQHFSMKHIAVVSSGSDNSGINGAIRAIVRAGSSLGARVSGIKWGFGGLVKDQIVSLTSRDVSGKIGKAGCFLGTAKPQGVLTPENLKIACDNLQKRGIDKLIVIGGYNSIETGRAFYKNGIQYVTIPSTIQDDVPGTDTSLGVDSAVNNIVKCVEKIRSGTSSRDRTYLVQVEGRTCGSLALRAAFVCGADWCLIPERPCDDDMDHLAKVMSEAYLKGKTQCLTIVASGWKPGIEALQNFLVEKEKETDLYVRTSVLGYVQRGGAPSGFDRQLGTEMGFEAVKAIMGGENDSMVAFRNGEIVTIPLNEVIGQTRVLDQGLFDMFKLTR